MCCSKSSSVVVNHQRDRASPGKAHPGQERLLHRASRLWDAETAKYQHPVSAGMEAALEAAFMFLGLGVPYRVPDRLGF